MAKSKDKMTDFFAIHAFARTHLSFFSSLIMSDLLFFDVVVIAVSSFISAELGGSLLQRHITPTVANP